MATTAATATAEYDLRGSTTRAIACGSTSSRRSSSVEIVDSRPGTTASVVPAAAAAVAAVETDGGDEFRNLDDLVLWGRQATDEGKRRFSIRQATAAAFRIDGEEAEFLDALRRADGNVIPSMDDEDEDDDDDDDVAVDKAAAASVIQDGDEEDPSIQPATAVTALARTRKLRKIDNANDFKDSAEASSNVAILLLEPVGHGKFFCPYPACNHRDWCTKSMDSNVWSFNIKRHMTRKHSNVFNEALRVPLEGRQEHCSQVKTAALDVCKQSGITPLASLRQPTLKRFFSDKRGLYLLYGSAGFCLGSNLSFAAFENPVLQFTIGRMCDGSMAKILSERSITNAVLEVVDMTNLHAMQYFQENCQNAVEVFDLWSTRRRRDNLLGLNFIYINKDSLELETYTPPLVEVESCTAAQLAAMVVAVTERVTIPSQKITGGTTDGGANVKAAVHAALRARSAIHLANDDPETIRLQLANAMSEDVPNAKTIADLETALKLAECGDDDELTACVRDLRKGTTSLGVVCVSHELHRLIYKSLKECPEMECVVDRANMAMKRVDSSDVLKRTLKTIQEKHGRRVLDVILHYEQRWTGLVRFVERTVDIYADLEELWRSPAMRRAKGNAVELISSAELSQLQALLHVLRPLREMNAVIESESISTAAILPVLLKIMLRLMDPDDSDRLLPGAARYRHEVQQRLLRMYEDRYPTTGPVSLDLVACMLHPVTGGFLKHLLSPERFKDVVKEYNKRAMQLQAEADELTPLVTGDGDDPYDHARQQTERCLLQLTGVKLRNYQTPGAFERVHPHLPGRFDVRDGKILLPPGGVQPGDVTGFLESHQKFKEFYLDANNKIKYHYPLQVALQVCHHQASSASAERVFSAAGLINTDLRTRLSVHKLTKMVAAVMAIKRHGPEFLEKVIEALVVRAAADK